MQKEKLAAIGLVLIVVIALSSFLIINYGQDILDNLFKSEETDKTIALGDCADVDYVGKYASNGTIFDSSYEDAVNKINGTPINVFVSLDLYAMPPSGYETYSSGPIEGIGFIEGLVGLEEGQSATIGPIPPEKAYGIYPKIGDTIDISNESFAQDIHLEFIGIIKDAPIPVEYIGYIEGDTTTIFVLKDNSYSIGQELTVYMAWPNSTVVSKLNDTMVWLETTPPADQMMNFTWKEIDPYTGLELLYWQDASNVTTMNDTTIIVTHTPDIGQLMTLDYGYYVTEYTIVNFNDTKINASYLGYDGNVTYEEFDRTITIERNQTQNITYEFPYDAMEYYLAIFKQYNPDLPYGIGPLAGEELLFEVEIVKVYNTAN